MKYRVGLGKKCMRDMPLDGCRVLVRVDYNVPFENGIIHDDYRIRASLPTLKYLLARGCSIVLCAHLGRPNGADAAYSLEPVALRLSELLARPVIFTPASIGDKVSVITKKMRPGQIALLENLRFHTGEERNDDVFARQLARNSYADYFVQDGFGVVHRKHASTDAITHWLPSAAGLLIEKEWQMLTELSSHPQLPLVAAIGGVKVSDKIGLIKKFVTVADQIIIGGAMANTFLAYRGYPIGKSIYEPDQEAVIEQLYRIIEKKVGRDNIDNYCLLPQDVAVGHAITATTKRVEKEISQVQPDDIILDIGSRSINEMIKAVGRAHTVLWNGTLGVATLPNFAHGSARLALSLATNPKISSVVGGGDTTDFVLGWDARDGRSFSHISTGGGAALELLCGKKLPGIEALMDS